MTEAQQDELFMREKKLLNLKMDVAVMEYEYWKQKLEELEEKI